MSIKMKVKFSEKTYKIIKSTADMRLGQAIERLRIAKNTRSDTEYLAHFNRWVDNWRETVKEINLAKPIEIKT